MERIGIRIKIKRESLGMQVKDLSCKIGATSSLISQIEKSKSFPSLMTIKKIADALETTVGELIGENDAAIQNPIVKPDGRKFVRKNRNGTRLFLLSNHDSNKQIEPYFVTFEKKSNSKEIMTTNYPCQEFCFVLKGSFEVILNEEAYTLNEGDSFYFDSHQTHFFTNISKDRAEMLWTVRLN